MVAPVALHPPLEGETIADVVERSGSLADRPYDWLELVCLTCWEESPHRKEFRAVDDDAIALSHRDPVPREPVVRLDNARIHELTTALAFAVRLGYALGRFEALPEPERLARARALAGLAVIVEPDPILTPDQRDARAD